MTQTGHFLFCRRGYLDLAPRQRQLAGSKTSRLWKCNAPQSSRFPSRRSRWNPPTKIFFDIILIIVYRCCTHSHHPSVQSTAAIIKDTPHFKSAVFLWIFNNYTGSKKAYLENTNFYQSSNILDFQVFALFESIEVA